MAMRYAVSASLWPACNAATSCSAALSVISLICSDFISVLLCGDLVPSLHTGEPKDRGRRRTEEEESAPEREATGVTPVRRWRDGVLRGGVSGKVGELSPAGDKQGRERVG